MKHTNTISITIKLCDWIKFFYSVKLKVPITISITFQISPHVLYLCGMVDDRRFRAANFAPFQK